MKKIIGFQKGYIPWNKGKKMSFSPRPKIKGKMPKNLKSIHQRMKGESNPNWKGGISPLNERIRKTAEYRLWREAVFKRDNWTCIWCNSKIDIKADHIKPFALYPELRFAIDNGRTLCEKCHRTTDTYGFRIFSKLEI